MVRLNAVESLTRFSGVRRYSVHHGEMEMEIDIDDAEGGSPSHGSQKAIERAQISIIQETAVQQLVRHRLVGMDDGHPDLTVWLIDFSEAVTQESLFTNGVPDSMLFTWKLSYIMLLFVLTSFSTFSR